MNGLLIGRFQPFHLGHLEALQFALSKVDKLWVGLGSSNKPIEKTIRLQLRTTKRNDTIIN